MGGPEEQKKLQFQRSPVDVIRSLLAVKLCTFRRHTDSLRRHCPLYKYVSVLQINAIQCSVNCMIFPFQSCLGSPYSNFQRAAASGSSSTVSKSNLSSSFFAVSRPCSVTLCLRSNCVLRTREYIFRSSVALNLNALDLQYAACSEC